MVGILGFETTVVIHAFNTGNAIRIDCRSAIRVQIAASQRIGEFVVGDVTDLIREKGR
jgi:hypothetical protein